jgi:hypothetical protein
MHSEVLLARSIKIMVAPISAINEPMISNQSGFFLSAIVPQIIEDRMNIPP